jgi:hypothetical protein
MRPPLLEGQQAWGGLPAARGAHLAGDVAMLGPLQGNVQRRPFGQSSRPNHGGGEDDRSGTGRDHEGPMKQRGASSVPHVAAAHAAAQARPFAPCGSDVKARTTPVGQSSVAELEIGQRRRRWQCASEEQRE